MERKFTFDDTLAAAEALREIYAGHDRRRRRGAQCRQPRWTE
jgi:hypothetical protein